jgi:putative NIF3 family GTP cyclohydrolase 1 type 2
VCTGAGASSETIREALDGDVDTLVVGEGPHHTAVEAGDLELTIVYAGHYATETLGVRALAEHLSSTFGLPSVFVHAPTGL